MYFAFVLFFGDFYFRRVELNVLDFLDECDSF